MLTTATHRRVSFFLAALFVLEWGILAFDPGDRAAWALENVLVAVLVAILVGTYRMFPLSLVPYILIFIFLSLHEIGAYYTYAQVPYDRWFEALTGAGLNDRLGWERNHFDRAMHFFYGLLFAYPIREIFLRIAQVRGFWGYFLPLDLTMSSSMTFELIEWLIVSIFGENVRVAYLATQGDPWDAHKDMALASLGAFLAMLAIAGVNFYLVNNFVREWRESLRIKYRWPLGERALRRMLKRKSERRT